MKYSLKTLLVTVTLIACLLGTIKAWSWNPYERHFGDTVTISEGFWKGKKGRVDGELIGIQPRFFTKYRIWTGGLVHEIWGWNLTLDEVEVIIEEEAEEPSVPPTAPNPKDKVA